MVISSAGNVINKPSLNSSLGCQCSLQTNVLEKGINPFLFYSVMDKIVSQTGLSNFSGTTNLELIQLWIQTPLPIHHKSAWSGKAP